MFDWCKIWRKTDMRNLANFLQSTFESLKILDFYWVFLSKVENVWAFKIHRGFMCHDNEEWCKIWTGIDWSVQNWHEEFNDFWLHHLKISMICTLMGCFWPKYIMFELRKYREVMFDGTQDWYKIWRKTDLCFQKWHEEFGKILPEHVRKSKNLDFYWVLLYKVENVRA